MNWLKMNLRKGKFGLHEVEPISFTQATSKFYGLFENEFDFS